MTTAIDIDVERTRRELDQQEVQARNELDAVRRRIADFDAAHPRRMTWAARARGAREALGLSQTMTARMAGISPSTLRHIERGDRDMSMLTAIRLSEALGVTTTWLVMDTDE